ncbi:MAG: hypothetical protein V1928_04780 [Parcubacteria group bacterium]
MNVKLQWFHYLFLSTVWLVLPALDALAVWFSYDRYPTIAEALLLAFPMFLCNGIFITLKTEEKWKRHNIRKLSWSGYNAVCFFYFLPSLLCCVFMLMTKNQNAIAWLCMCLPLAILLGAFLADKANEIFSLKYKNTSIV